VGGSKNAALPLLFATMLTCGVSTLTHVPDIADVHVTLAILAAYGAQIERTATDTYRIDTTHLSYITPPAELVDRIRASTYLLGVSLARFGRAVLQPFGGCAFSERPIDMHLKALRRLGAVIKERHGWLDCRAPHGLKGADIALPFPSVGATEEVLLAACTAEGVTTLTNAAREPEISDLADYLNRCGACIRGAGESVIRIEGVRALRGCAHAVIPDRIVAATLIACAAVTGSSITVKGVIHSHLSAVLPVFEDAGCTFSAKENELHMTAPARLHSMKIVRTMPYPGFPTDAQSPLLAAAAVADGTTVLIENIFENRYRHVAELTRMGADIKTEGKFAVIDGVPQLYGAAVEATDLRGAAALVVAGLCAEGKTELDGVKYLDRGYEHFEQALTSLGADIKRI
jgi:UDP-N-acetylglucosamine 1-carboxyvinyltransferase